MGPTTSANTKANVEKEEFMSTMKRRSMARFWDNDDAVAPVVGAGPRNGPSLGDGEGTDGGGRSEEDGGGDLHSGDEGHGGDVLSRVEGRPGGEEMSDMDWLRSKTRSGGMDEIESSESRSIEEEEEEGEEEEGEEDEGEERGRGREQHVSSRGTCLNGEDGGGGGLEEEEEEEEENEEQGEESGLSAGRLFVRNLPYTCTEEDLREVFGSYGTLSDVHLPVDDVKKCKGFGFIQYLIPEDSQKALVELDKQSFKGRLLHIIPARRQPGTGSGVDGGRSGRFGTGGLGGTYKEQKEHQRRLKAGNSVGWNAAFVRGDTVVDSLADRLGVGKGDILDKDEGDMAVRLALGETSLVLENKEYFEKEGVDLSALESSKTKEKAAQRSATVILVKNLPYTTEAPELAKLFGAFGDVRHFAGWLVCFLPRSCWLLSPLVACSLPACSAVPIPAPALLLGRMFGDFFFVFRPCVESQSEGLTVSGKISRGVLGAAIWHWGGHWLHAALQSPIKLTGDDVESFA
ncbi:unnamed protein product [Discosporangium mesarthrocarpum]